MESRARLGIGGSCVIVAIGKGFCFMFCQLRSEPCQSLARVRVSRTAESHDAVNLPSCKSPVLNKEVDGIEITCGKIGIALCPRIKRFGIVKRFAQRFQKDLEKRA